MIEKPGPHEVLETRANRMAKLANLHAPEIIIAREFCLIKESVEEIVDEKTMRGAAISIKSGLIDGIEGEG